MQKIKKSYNSLPKRKMSENPWRVDSIEEFACLKCPECVFFSKEEPSFRDHAKVCIM